MFNVHDAPTCKWLITLFCQLHNYCSNDGRDRKQIPSFENQKLLFVVYCANYLLKNKYLPLGIGNLQCQLEALINYWKEAQITNPNSSDFHLGSF